MALAFLQRAFLRTFHHQSIIVQKSQLEKIKAKWSCIVHEYTADNDRAEVLHILDACAGRLIASNYYIIIIRKTLWLSMIRTECIG